MYVCMYACMYIYILYICTYIYIDFSHKLWYMLLSTEFVFLFRIRRRLDVYCIYSVNFYNKITTMSFYEVLGWLVLGVYGIRIRTLLFILPLNAANIRFTLNSDRSSLMTLWIHTWPVIAAFKFSVLYIAQTNFCILSVYWLRLRILFSNFWVIYTKLKNALCENLVRLSVSYHKILELLLDFH